MGSEKAELEQNLQLLLGKLLLAPREPPKTSHKVFLFSGWAEFGSTVLSNDVLVMKRSLVKVNYVMRVSGAA